MRILAPLLVGLLAPSTFAQDAASAAGNKKIEVLLITGANNHAWQYTSRVHEKTLESTGRFNVKVTRDPSATLANREAIAKYDVFFLDYNSNDRWGEDASRNFLAAVEGGIGVAVIHAANNAFPGWVEYEKLVGHCWREGTGHGRFHEFDVEIIDRKHPITLGMPMLRTQPDELYHRLVHMHGAKHRVLMQAMSAKDTGGSGNHEPMCMVKNYGKGRVFHTPLGHVWPRVEATRRSIHTAQFKLLIARGTEWAATGRVTIQPAAFGLKPPAPNTLTQDEEKAGWELLFDGKSTGSWRGYRKDSFPEQGWVVEDGTLVKVKGQRGGDIITTEMYGNFEFQCEWKIENRGNSGIMYLCTEEDSASYMTGPELQILDDSGHPKANPKTTAGALYGIHACKEQVYKPGGQWNHALIRVEYPNVEHWFNGIKVVEYRLDDEQFRELITKTKFRRWANFATAREGHIALQDHGNHVAFRNLKIRRLPGKAETKPDGKQLFRLHCASCHGKGGKGDGIQGLNPPPRDLTSGQFSFGTSPRAITKTIQEGIPPLMMEFKSRLSAAEIKKIVGFVRKLLPREPNPPAKISTMEVTDAARITYGYLPPRKRGGLPVARGLAIGLPGGLSFEYRRDGLRLMRVFDGAFVDRVSWRGRGGRPVRFLGRRFWQDAGGNPPSPILAADKKTPLEVRFRGSWHRGAEAGTEARVLDANLRTIANLAEDVSAHSLSYGRGFTRRIEFRDVKGSQRIVLRVGALSAKSVELDRKERDAGSWREHWLVARYDVQPPKEKEKKPRGPIASTYQCLVVRHPQDMDATLMTDKGVATLEFELLSRESIPITTTFLRADAWSSENVTAIRKEIDR